MADLTISNFRAGDTFKLVFDLAAFPASQGWSVTYILAGPQTITIIGSIENGQHVVLSPSATTENWGAGDYTAFIQASKDGEKLTKQVGYVSILPAATSLTNYDGRSHVKKVLDALQALLEKKALKDVESYTINGREITKFKPEELLRWRNQYAELYRQELAKQAVSQGKKPGNIVLMRF